MAKFLRIAAASLVALWAVSAMASNVEDQLQALVASHESAKDGVSDRTMGRLAAGAEPEDGEGVYSRAYIQAQPEYEGGKEWYCMAEALYFEARGESVMGQFAVAEVILNRVDSRAFPDTICTVVNQGSGRGKYRCQFTYTCDGKLEVINEKRAWADVGRVAKLAIEMDRRPLTGGATYYHTNYVSPSWSKTFPRTATIGYHHFYTDPQQISLR